MLLSRGLAQVLQIPFISRPAQDGICAQSVSASGPSKFYSPLNKNFELLINQTMLRYHVPGLAVAIVNGEETFSQGYGMARWPDLNVTPETIFNGASTTKAFISAALSILIDGGEKDRPNIDWQTTINSIIPEDFVLQDDYATLHLTIEDAATHRTGFPRHDLAVQGGNQTVQEVVRSLRYLPLTAPLRTRFQYSNLMYITLGHIIQTLAGHWTGKFIADRIWKPLNMTSTFFSLSDTLDSGKPFATGQYWRSASQEYTEVPHIDETSMEGAGAVFSTVNDYAKWLRTMINRSLPISRDGHEALVTPHMLEEKDWKTGNFIFYGYGWEMQQYRGYKVIHHNGVDTGVGTKVLYIPEMSWGVVMMSNIEVYSSLAQEILTWHLIDDLLETPKSERINMTGNCDQYVANIIAMRNITLVKELLYPPNSTSNLPASLPLDAYAGTYNHPGYGHWPISFENGTLWNHMNRTDVLVYNGKLHHITADHFLIVAYNKDEPDDPIYVMAEFKLDIGGSVLYLGLNLEEEMGEEKIWFKQI